MADLETKVIAIDAMTAEAGVGVLCSAARKYSEKNPNVKLVLFGNHDLLDQKNMDVLTTECLYVKGVVDKDESFTAAGKKFKEEDNSTRKTLEYVRDGRADVGISFGRTDLIVTYAGRIIGGVGQIKKYPLAVFLPSKASPNKYTLLMDVGAFNECTAEELLHSAIMGSCFYELKSKKKPKVGLLNIGTEKHKGPVTVRSADKLLERYAKRDGGFDYAGFVEAGNIYSNRNGREVDVIVTDGFTGNVGIKLSEGLADFAIGEIKRSFELNPLTKLGGLLYKLGGGAKQLKDTLNPDQYGGAYFLGLRGLFVKGHGSANEHAIQTAITRAQELGEGWGLHRAILKEKIDIAKELTGETAQG